MSVGLKQSYDIEYNGTANVARMDLFADTVADLAGLTTVDGITLLQGSTAEDISTGDVYMMQTGGTWVKQPSQSAFANVYTKAEIDSMLYLYYTKTEADAMFEWITVTISTDTLPLMFIADGSPIISWSMKGNGSQQGTPTPSAPIMPDFVGTLDDSDWTIPISCGGETTPVYLGQTQTVRRIRKMVLTGNEQGWARYRSGAVITILSMKDNSRNIGLCSHFNRTFSPSTETGDAVCFGASNNIFYMLFSDATVSALNITDLNSIKQWLQDEYAAGHPVTIWYVLATEQTGITNEPLCKIGDYADELSSEDAAVTIPTVRGQNVLTVDSGLQPSEMAITGKIREVTENEQ